MAARQTSPSYRIHTFGPLQIHHANELLPLKGERPRSLLAYLVLHPRILHRREMLADRLWPDAPPDRVRRNLSDVLYRLQKTVNPVWLTVGSDAIGLQPDTNLWVDVWEFDRLIASKDTTDLQQAVDLYVGDLLPEIYDDWILAERELRRSQVLSALETLSAYHEAQGSLQQALHYARRLILTEPLHEPAHQSYLRLLGRLKRYGEAMAHYEYLRLLIHSELNSAPMAETRSIIQSLERERDLENVPVMVDEAESFIGRKAERAAALTVVEAMLNGNGGLLTVEGEAGIGKSRLLREIAAGAGWRGATVLKGQASQTPGMSPFSPLVEALTPLFNSPHGKHLEALLEKETRAMLGPLFSEWNTKDISYELPPEQAGRRFRDALRIFGETLPRLTPVVLMLDDLHWAGPVLWESLRAFAPGFVQRGGMLILSYRRPEIEKLPGWEILQSWDRDGLLKSISLEPLSVDEVAQFVGGISDVDLVEIHAWTGGNPFFINEWLAEPDMKRPTKRKAISLRMQTISSTTKAVLESASILGESIPYQLWMEISGLSPLALAGLSDELMMHHWLQPSTTGYAFTHDLIRSAVYDQIEPVRRHELHERAARAYQTLEPDNARSCAFHLDRAGRETDAARAYRRAGEQDLSRFAFQEAQIALDRALALMPATATIERSETALILAQACDATGDRVRQKSALEEALAGAEDRDGHRLRALLAGGRFAIHTGQVAEAEKQLEAALALARELHDPAREIDAITLFSNLAVEQEKWSDVQNWSRQELERAQASGNQLAEGRALRNLGIVTRILGRPDESLEWLEKAVAVQRAIGNRLQVSITQTNMLATLNELGAWDRLITIAQETVPVLEALGDQVGATVARHNQSLAYYALGEYAVARQILIRVIEDSQLLQSRRRAGFARNVLGLVSEAEGNHEDAIRLLRLALDDAAAVQGVQEMAYAQHDLGALFVRTGRVSKAISLLEAARAVWVKQEKVLLQLKSEAYLGLAFLKLEDRARAEEMSASGWTAFQSGVPVGEQPQDWLWALHLLLTGLGQPDEAKLALRAAYTELQRQSRQITDPNLRTSFFERVPLNRNIIMAHDQLAGTPRVISMSIARKGVPLGRSLREDEFVTVQWTVNAPEDESISDKAARRHQRLKRLLEEAEIQGAAPTDDDLASALEVSRRTILRDMRALAQEIPTPPTRKRKGTIPIPE